MEKHQYKIKEQGQSPIDHVIEKSNVSVDFTVRQVSQNVELMLKSKRELQAKLDYEKARIVNVEHFHKFVKRLSPVELQAAYIYVEAKEFVSQIVPKIAELEVAVATDLASLAEVERQIGIKATDDVTTPQDGKQDSGQDKGG
jgi:hypothetical protein